MRFSAILLDEVARRGVTSNSLAAQGRGLRTRSGSGWRRAWKICVAKALRQRECCAVWFSRRFAAFGSRPGPGCRSSGFGSCDGVGGVELAVARAAEPFAGGVARPPHRMGATAAWQAKAASLLNWVTPGFADDLAAVTRAARICAGATWWDLALMRWARC